MISGIISGVLEFTDNTYKDLKIKKQFRTLILHTDFDFKIDVIIPEDMFNEYTTEIKENGLNISLGRKPDYRFVVDGELRSVDVKLRENNLTNLYIRAKRIYKREDYNVNLFYLDGFATKTAFEANDAKYFKVAANKTIINSMEKKSKAAYALLKTSKGNSYVAKDVLQGNVKLIYENNIIKLESLYIVKSSCEHFEDLIRNVAMDPRIQSINNSQAASNIKLNAITA